MRPGQPAARHARGAGRRTGPAILHHVGRWGDVPRLPAQRRRLAVVPDGLGDRRRLDHRCAATRLQGRQREINPRGRQRARRDRWRFGARLKSVCVGRVDSAPAGGSSAVIRSGFQGNLAFLKIIRFIHWCSLTRTASPTSICRSRREGPRHDLRRLGSCRRRDRRRDAKDTRPGDETT